MIILQLTVTAEIVVNFNHSIKQKASLFICLVQSQSYDRE